MGLIVVGGLFVIAAITIIGLLYRVSELEKDVKALQEKMRYLI